MQIGNVAPGFQLVVVCTCALICSFPRARADERLTPTEIRRLIVGKTVSWNDGGGQSHYAAGGAYRYTRGGRVGEGSYRIMDGGVCMQFTSGKLRCDAWYKSSGQFYIKTMRSKENPKPSVKFEIISIR